MKRRAFLQTILAAGVAPAYIGSGILMPVREVIVPDNELIRVVRITGEGIGRYLTAVNINGEMVKVNL